MDEHTERVSCPVCGKEIVVVLEWQEAEYDVGISEGWIPGYAVEDGACIAHLAGEQSATLLDLAAARHTDDPPPGYDSEEIFARADMSYERDYYEREMAAERMANGERLLEVGT